MGEIAGDTKTLSTNILDRQLEALKESKLRNRVGSVSDLVRYAIHAVAKIEDPELARRWEEARTKRWVINASVLIVGGLAVFQTTLCQVGKARSRPQFVRTSAVRCILRHELIIA